jgi:outer membrane protein assembly factor BamB
MARAAAVAALLLSGALLVANTTQPPSNLESVVTANGRDWPMLGGSPNRNLVNLAERNLPETWDVTRGTNVKWSAKLGSQSYGGPVIAEGKLFVGTNNGQPRNPRIKGDKGILMCFREKDGAFLWQAVHDKHPAGRVHDWPEQGVASFPCVEGNRLYYMSNLCELVCADTEGFADGNQGLQDEQYRGATDADIVWKLDLMKELGVRPHNLAASSPLVHEELVFVVTGNGHDESHQHLPAPKAPSFLCVHKLTGKVVWTDNSPGKNILHAQWSSPTLISVNGRPQIVFPGGDGWLRSFEPRTGKLLWKFDGNPKKAVWKIGGRGDRSDFVAPAIFHAGLVYVAMGQDPEHGDGVGHLWCIDPSKASPTNVDLTPVKDNLDPKSPENKHSGLVWHFGGTDPDGGYRFRRSLSFSAVNEGLCFVADLAGYVHCLNAKTGERYWEYDTVSNIWGAPFWADGKIYVGNEEGEVHVFHAGKACRLVSKVTMEDWPMSGTVVAANGVLYVKTKCNLHALTASPKRREP